MYHRDRRVTPHHAKPASPEAVARIGAPDSVAWLGRAADPPCATLLAGTPLRAIATIANIECGP